MKKSSKSKSKSNKVLHFRNCFKKQRNNSSKTPNLRLKLNTPTIPKTNLAFSRIQDYIFSLTFLCFLTNQTDPKTNNNNNNNNKRFFHKSEYVPQQCRSKMQETPKLVDPNKDPKRNDTTVTKKHNTTTKRIYLKPT